MGIEEVHNAIYFLKKIKRNNVSPLVKHIAYRPVFNVDCYREAVLHRFIDLADGAVASIEAKQLISALVIARATQETFSVLAYVSFKLEKFVSDRDLKSLLDTMKRLSMGWKGDDKFPEIINVLTCVDAVNKKMDTQFRQHYDRLSEFVHPNYAGVLGVYSDANHETLNVKIGLTENASNILYNLVESTILICCTLIKKIEEDYDKLMNKALDVCIELHQRGLLRDIFYQ